ncbi:MAG: hypothetical protein U5J63_03410 [Fodinibius sp.]|nr:hypothetical protein [Fodinibius sp.]
MSQQSIDLVALFKYSYNQYAKYASFVIGAMLTYIVLAMVPQVYLSLNTPKNPTTTQQFVSVFVMLLQAFLGLGFTKIMLRLVQNAFVEVADMFNNFSRFLSYFVASFLYGVGIIVGGLLLVVPGIWVAIRFQFYPYFIIEENVSSFTALKMSYDLSEDLTFELFLFGVAVVLLNLVGIMLFGIGIVFTYPLTTMATAVVYKSLTEGGQEIPSDSYRL